MLGKLIKHEWKSTAKIGCLMLFIMVLITFFGWLAFQSPMWQSISNDSYEASLMSSFADIISFFTLMMYVIMLCGVTYGIMIFFAVRFYKTMYTDQGYLLHTLPVTKRQILGSKILVGGIWYMLITIAVCLSVIALGASLIAAFIPAGYSFADLWAEMSVEMDGFWEAVKDELGINPVMWLIYLIIAVVVSPFSSVMIMYGAITIGQLFTKYRVLMAIVSYIGIMVVVMLLGSVVQGISSAMSFSNILEESTLSVYGNYMLTSLYGGTVINVLTAVILYFVSHHILEKKLNME